MPDRFHNSYTNRNLKRRLGAHPSLPFLDLNAFTTPHFEDDFHGDTLNSTYQSTASGANSVAAAISTGVVNGAIKLDAGDANAGRCDLSLGLHFRGDCACRAGKDRGGRCLLGRNYGIHRIL